MSGRHALTGGRSDHRSNFIPQTSIPDLPLQRYAGKNGNAAIDVVVDDHFALGMVLAMQTADVLGERAFPRDEPKTSFKESKTAYRRRRRRSLRRGCARSPVRGALRHVAFRDRPQRRGARPRSCRHLTLCVKVRVAACALASTWYLTGPLCMKMMGWWPSLRAPSLRNIEADNPRTYLAFVRHVEDMAAGMGDAFKAYSGKMMAFIHDPVSVVADEDARCIAWAKSHTNGKAAP